VELHVPHPGREDHDRGGGGSRGGLAVTEPRSCLRKDVRKLCKWIWWSSDAGLQSYTRTLARTCWTETEGAEKEILKLTGSWILRKLEVTIASRLLSLLHRKQGPTRHRSMVHPILITYLSYSTTPPQHAVPWAGLGHVCSE
jgi:hypothetical protein